MKEEHLNRIIELLKEANKNGNSSDLYKISKILDIWANFYIKYNKLINHK